MQDKLTTSPTVEVCIKWKKKECTINGRMHVAKDGVPFALTIDDFVGQGVVGFGALHDKLKVMAKQYRFDYDALVQHIAYSSITRVTHLTRHFKIPRFVAMTMIDSFIGTKACIIEQSGMRKTAAYVMYLRTIVESVETRSTITSGTQTSRKYRMPPEVGDDSQYGETLDTMGSGQLQEQLDTAIEKGAKLIIRDKIMVYLKAALAREKQREAEEEVPIKQPHVYKKGKRKPSAEVQGYLDRSARQKAKEDAIVEGEKYNEETQNEGQHRKPIKQHNKSRER